MSFPRDFIEYTNVLQVQLRTGRGKPRVWFATGPEGPVVIKGPVQEVEREGCRKSEELKQRLGLPHAAMRIRGEYLIWDCLFDYTTLERHIASSPFDPPTEVPVQEFHYPWDDSKLPTLGLEILIALAFRKIIGAHDTCIQNFLVPPAAIPVVYSIDDPALEKETKFMWKCKVDPRIWEPVLEEHWNSLQESLQRWEEGGLEEKMLERLKLLQNRTGWRWA